MNTIFLDIDGVLNNATTEERTPTGFLGIDDSLLEKLSILVKDTNSQLILVSSWKDFWGPNGTSTDKDGFYIDEKFAKFDLKIADKTIDDWSNRGEGIASYIKINSIEKFVVLDDEKFSDYKKYDILPHLIKTNSSLGLTDYNIITAKQMLEE